MNVVLIAGLIGLAGAAFFFWAGFKARNQAQQVDGGVDAEATIIERHAVGSGRSRTLYVTFQFEAVDSNGINLTYTHQEEVKADNYHDLTEQTKVTIRYLPSDPAGSARLSGIFKDSSDSISPFAYGTGCLIGALLVIGVAVSTGIQSSQQASATSAYLTTQSPDLSLIEMTLKPYMTQWEAVKDQDAHFVSSTSVGLSNVTQEQIVYGYCPDKTFYIYVPKGAFREGVAPNIHGSDAYTFYSTTDDLCWPSGWIATKKGDLGDGWSLSLIVRIDATATPVSTEQSIPTEQTSG